jgi:hypothetical protein
MCCGEADPGDGAGSGVRGGVLATAFGRAVGAAEAPTLSPPGATTMDVRTT